VEKIETLGVHHLTFVGADRDTSIGFWEGVLGMPLVLEQPNLDVPGETHLFFDPGDGRLITVFSSESRAPEGSANPTDAGNLHHVAFAVSRATFDRAANGLRARRIASSGAVDRGFMDSIYFREPLGQLIELSCYRFEPPPGTTNAQVLGLAQKIRVARKDSHVADEHVAAAVEELRGSRG
jgi:catechol 2,3-dioxygenase-like lactoylglutathione lyase family enzyme